MHEIGLERTSPQHGHGRSLSWISMEHAFLPIFVIKYQQKIIYPQLYQQKVFLLVDPIIAFKLT